MKDFEHHIMGYMVSNFTSGANAGNSEKWKASEIMVGFSRVIPTTLLDQ
jgi:hypothetical protein